MVPSIIYASLHSTYIICTYLSGLVGNLKTSSPKVFKFYSYLKDCVPPQPLLPEEKCIASGKVELSSTKLAGLVKVHGAHQVLRLQWALIVRLVLRVNWWRVL